MTGAAVSPWTARLALGLPLALLLACCLPMDCLAPKAQKTTLDPWPGLAPTRGPGRGGGELPPHARQAREPRAGGAAEGVGCQALALAQGQALALAVARGRDPNALGVDYNGTASTTVGGRTCQVWSETTPHQHDI